MLYEKEKGVKTKIKEKKKEEKQILEELEAEENKRRAEKNERIVKILTENLGEISDEDISLFERVIKSNSQNLLNTKQQISYKQDY